MKVETKVIINPVPGQCQIEANDYLNDFCSKSKVIDVVVTYTLIPSVNKIGTMSLFTVCAITIKFE